jgi:hypothetical protein
VTSSSTQATATANTTATVKQTGPEDSLTSFKVPEALVDFLKERQQASFLVETTNTTMNRDKLLAESSLSSSSLTSSSSAANPSALTYQEALHALIECFASARKIAES